VNVFRYLAVGLIGAAIGGYVVARATGALPRMASQFMSQMMEKMSPEERERCQEMMARFRSDGHQTAAADATRAEEGPKTIRAGATSRSA
jgi:hypothetical protein